MKKYSVIYADPPWRYKVYSKKGLGRSAESHYPTMSLEDIKALPIGELAAKDCALFMWITFPCMQEAFQVLEAWGFEYKTNIVWEKVRKDGQPDGRGVGFYFRNVTELLLFGIKGDRNRTLDPARSQVNLIRTMKREHSRKPDEIFPIIEACSPGPYLEMFARGIRPGWTLWGDQANDPYAPDWATYANHTNQLNTNDKLIK